VDTANLSSKRGEKHFITIYEKREKSASATAEEEKEALSNSIREREEKELYSVGKGKGTEARLKEGTLSPLTGVSRAEGALLHLGKKKETTTELSERMRLAALSGKGGVEKRACTSARRKETPNGRRCWQKESLFFSKEKKDGTSPHKKKDLLNG